MAWNRALKHPFQSMRVLLCFKYKAFLESIDVLLFEVSVVPSSYLCIAGDEVVYK